MSQPKTTEDRLCDAVTAVLNLMGVHRGDALLRVENGFVGPEASLDRTWLIDQLRQVQRSDGHESKIASVDKALAAVVADFDALSDRGEEWLGDELSTTLSEETYTVQTLWALRTWVTAQGTQQLLAGEELVANARNKLEMHTPIQQSDYRLRRTAVDRAKEWLKARQGTRVDLRDVAQVVSPTDAESNLTSALAFQACMEAGFRTESDKWIRQMGDLLNPDKVGFVNVPIPTPRSLRMGLLHVVHLGSSGLERGLPTGDVWLGEPATECVGMDTVNTYASKKTGLRPSEDLVFSRFSPRAVVSRLDDALAGGLKGIEEGKNDAISLLYETLQDHAMSCVPPTGRTNAVAWRLALNSIRREESALADVLNETVGLRALIAIYAGAADCHSFCRGLVDRVLGSTASAGLELNSNGHTTRLVYENGAPRIRGAAPEDVGEDMQWVIGILRSIDEERGLVSAFDDRWSGGSAGRQTEDGFVLNSSEGSVAHKLWEAECDAELDEGRSTSPLNPRPE